MTQSSISTDHKIVSKAIASGTEISLEAVKIYVSEITGEDMKIVSDASTGLRVIIPKSSSISTVVENYSEVKGFFITDNNDMNITSLGEVFTFSSDTTETGNYTVEGILNGTLTIAGRQGIATHEVVRLLEIENTLH